MPRPFCPESSRSSPLLAAPASAQTWPSRNIRVIVPFPAGGVADIGARLVSQKLAEALGQPAVIENRAGASGTLGVDAVTKAPPDGYTILITTGDFITVPSLMPATAYDPYKDLIPVTRIATPRCCCSPIRAAASTR